MPSTITHAPAGFFSQPYRQVPSLRNSTGRRLASCETHLPINSAGMSAAFAVAAKTNTASTPNSRRPMSGVRVETVTPVPGRW